ncbi:MAG: type IV pilus twitching motility protein PilT [Candidatus Eremiobacteraeota bacterium]|nr:type IV pilus twitching motility protein PilT [Candidatus Eremiobacteraeota bacterium]
MSDQQGPLQALLRHACASKASDVHLEVGSVPRIRINGDMIRLNMPVLTQKQAEAYLMPLMDERLSSLLSETGNADFSYSVKGAACYRVNFLMQHYGLGAVFRVIPQAIPSFEELGLPGIIRNIALCRRGFILMTGATGSGKSTTLAAMIQYVNERRRAHIITIEDPVEFVYRSELCLIDQREIGRHATSFASAIRAALRESPDIILVGELRDYETISLAIKAAEMGVLVMGTLHTNNASKAVDRMIDAFPPREQDQVRTMLSQSLKAVIAQMLLKTADGKGRVPAVEILIAAAGLPNLIREGRASNITSFIQTGRGEGMQTMDHALIELARAGKIKPELALERAYDQEMVSRHISSQ